MKKVLVVFSALAIVGVCAGAAVLASQSTVLPVNFAQADETDARLILNNGNARTTELSPFQHFTYSDDASDSKNNGFVRLNAGGFFRKTEESRGLNKINVTFSGDLKVETWYEGNDPEDDYFTYFLTSGSDQTIVGNYFRVVALADNTDITELRLWYNCEESSVRPASEVSINLNDNKKHERNFGWLENRNNGDVYLAVQGTYTGALAKNDLVLYDEMDTGKIASIDADALSILEDNYFEARFNLSSMYRNTDNASAFNVRRDTMFGSFDWVGHLKLKGNEKGNFGPANSSTTATSVDDTSQSDAHVKYSLRTENWNDIHTLVATFTEKYYAESPVKLTEMRFAEPALKATASISDPYNFSKISDGNLSKWQFKVTKFDDSNVTKTFTPDSVSLVSSDEDGTRLIFTINDIGTAFNDPVNFDYPNQRFKIDLQYANAETTFKTVDSGRESSTYDRQNPSSTASGWWGLFEDGTGYSIIANINNWQ